MKFKLRVHCDNHLSLSEGSYVFLLSRGMVSSHLFAIYADFFFSKVNIQWMSEEARELGG